jgi:hypothetical protein
LRIVVVFRIRKEAPLVYWTLRIVVVFRIRKEAPLVYWTLRIVGPPFLFLIPESHHYNYPQGPID